jgi:hypothetical protein
VGLSVSLNAPRGAVIAHTLQRWPTILIVLAACAGIAGTILWLDANPIWIALWVTFGLVGVGALTLSALRDEESVADALLADIQIGELHDRALREKVARAAQYQRAIRRAVRQTSDDLTRSSLEMITRQMREPIEMLFRLARRLENYQNDALIRADSERLAQQERRGRLTPAEQAQLADLGRLQALMTNTAGAIDETLAELGRQYAEVQVIRSSGELRGGQADRLRAELDERGAQLRDLSSSLDEVYADSKQT